MPGAMSTPPTSSDGLLIAMASGRSSSKITFFILLLRYTPSTNSFRLDSTGNRLWGLHPDVLGSAFTEEQTTQVKDEGGKIGQRIKLNCDKLQQGLHLILQRFPKLRQPFRIVSIESRVSRALYHNFDYLLNSSSPRGSVLILTEPTSFRQR